MFVCVNYNFIIAILNELIRVVMYTEGVFCIECDFKLQIN